MTLFFWEHRYDNDKKKALQSALSQIEKQFGKGAIMRMGENEVAKDLQVVSTGLGLDLALGIGGFPKGRGLKYMALNLLEKQL